MSKVAGLGFSADTPRLESRARGHRVLAVFLQPMGPRTLSPNP